MVGRSKCEFCQGDGFIEDEYGEWKLESVQCSPLPQVLLSGPADQQRNPSEDPYYALLLKYLDEDFGSGAHASFPVNFCPVCGRQLNKNYPTHWEGSTLVMSAKDWVAFQKQLRSPEVIRKRDEFLAELDKIEVTVNPDGSYDVPFTPKGKR